MVASLLALMLAAGAARSTPDTQFVATLAPVPGSVVPDGEGVAQFVLTSGGIQYHVTVRNLKQITDVAVVDARGSVSLGVPSAKSDGNLDFSGTVSSAPNNGLSLTDLMQDIQDGKAKVMVFTKRDPGGAVTGTLVPGVAPSQPFSS